MSHKTNCSHPDLCPTRRLDDYQQLQRERPTTDRRWLVSFRKQVARNWSQLHGTTTRATPIFTELGTAAAGLSVSRLRDTIVRQRAVYENLRLGGAVRANMLFTTAEVQWQWLHQALVWRSVSSEWQVCYEALDLNEGPLR